jgi:alpha-tubulin suppressor-like RCC1 family protein
LTSLPAVNNPYGVVGYNYLATTFSGWVLYIDSLGNPGLGTYSSNTSNNRTTNTSVVSGSITINTWKHVAMTVNGTAVNIYVNGILVTTAVQNIPPDYVSATLSIGRWNYSSAYRYFPGYISNVRLVKNVIVYTGNFTAPTNILRTTQSAMTNIVALTGTETTLLTLQNSTIIDNSTNNFTITNNGSVPITTAYVPFVSTTGVSSTTWDSIIAGVTSTMGTSNNTLFTWGAGTGGQLADNTTTTKSAPSTTGVGSIWSVNEKLFSSPVQVGIATGGSHAIALATDNSLWSWGVNNIGQFGDNTTVGKSSPTQIAGNSSSYTFITAGVSNTFAVRATTALLYAWGQNNIGQIGDSSTVAGRSSPVQVFTGTMTSPLIPIKLNTVSGSSYTQVQAGSAATVIDSVGRLYTWGTNTNGQVGDNTTISRSSPVQLGGLQFTYINSPVQVGTSSYNQVSAGSSHTLAIDSNSLLYAWGKTPANGDTITRSSPIQIGTNSYVFVSAGTDASLAVDTNRILYAWGLNTNYQLGSPSFYLNQSVTSPVAIGTLAVDNVSRSMSAGSGEGGFIKNI